MKRIRTKEDFIKINTLYTHGGVFHADEVFSTALINIVREYFKLPLIFPERGFNPHMDDDTCLVYDIGGGVYDHHQKDAEFRTNGDKYASFGLLWRDLAPLLNLTDEEVSYIDNILVKEIDLTDNFGTQKYPNLLSCQISKMNVNWNEDDKWQEEKFLNAVKIAIFLLCGDIRSARSKFLAKSLVMDKVEEAKESKIIILDQFMPWLDFVLESNSNANFCIFPSNRGGYNIQCIPISKEDGAFRCPFNEEYYGLRNSDILPKGATFCHASGFLMAVDTLENAVRICNDTMNK